MNIKYVNLMFGILGLLIIWFGTYSIIGVLGGIIAGIHLIIKLDK